MIVSFTSHNSISFTAPFTAYSTSGDPLKTLSRFRGPVQEAGEKKDEEEIRNETGVRRRSIPAHHQKDSPGVHARAEEGGSSNLFASPI